MNKQSNLSSIQTRILKMKTSIYTYSDNLFSFRNYNESSELSDILNNSENFTSDLEDCFNQNRFNAIISKLYFESIYSNSTNECDDISDFDTLRFHIISK